MGVWTGRQDAFGLEVYHLFKGEDALEIAERDDGWVAVSGGAAAYMREHKDWAAHQKRAIALARGRVLDVGCGAGRVGLYLQEKGLDVLCIDNSPLAIKVCKLRGVRKARVVSVTRFTAKADTFDTIVMYGNNFGLFANRKRARWLLKRFAGMTTAPARIIAESNDPYQTKTPEHLEYHAHNRRRGRMSGQLRIRIRHRCSATPWFDWLLVSKDEMSEIADGTGWEVTRFFDSKGSAYIGILEKTS